MKKALIIWFLWRLVTPGVLPAQTIYELDLADPTTYEVTCYRILNPSHWTVTNDSCSLYTPLFPVSSSCVSDSTLHIPVMLRINQSGNLWATEYANIHYYQEGNWLLLDSIVGNLETANQTYLYEIPHHTGDLFGLRVTFVSRHNTHDWQLSDGDIIIYDPCVSLLPIADELTVQPIAEGALVTWWWPEDPGLEWVELLAGPTPDDLASVALPAVQTDSLTGKLYRWLMTAIDQPLYVQALGNSYNGDEVLSDIVLVTPVVEQVHIWQERSTAQPTVWVASDWAGDAYLRLVNMAGATIAQEIIRLEKGHQLITLPAPLPAGAYLMLLELPRKRVVSTIIL